MPPTDITPVVAEAAKQAATAAIREQTGAAPPLPPKAPPPPPAPAFADAAKARRFQEAAYHLNNGVDPKLVAERMAATDPDWAPDTRSDHERMVDRQYNIAERYDPKVYAFHAPPGVASDMAGAAKMNSDLTDLAAGLAFDVNGGSRFCASIAREIAAGNAATMRDGRAMFGDEVASVLAARVTDNESKIAQIFRDPTKLSEARAAVAELVDGLKLPNKALADGLKPGGILCTPAIFSALLSRSRHIAAWHTARQAPSTPSKGTFAGQPGVVMRLPPRPR